MNQNPYEQKPILEQKPVKNYYEELKGVKQVPDDEEEPVAPEAPE